MNRRRLLTAVPAVGFAGLIGAGAVPAIASAETPISVLYQEWFKQWTFANSGNTTEEEHEAACSDLGRLEGLILAENSESAEDVLIKISVASEFGGFGLDNQDFSQFWDEAREMIAA